MKAAQRAGSRLPVLWHCGRGILAGRSSGYSSDAVIADPAPARGNALADQEQKVWTVAEAQNFNAENLLIWLAWATELLLCVAEVNIDFLGEAKIGGSFN